MTAGAPPLNLAQLNARVEEVARELGVPEARVRTMLCTLVVSQMLPAAVAVKGGMGVKLRLGERGTRATADPRPDYVMHPYRVSLSFLGKAWAALDVEVSDPEIEDSAHSRREIDAELIELGARFGFGELRPVELVDLEHQIAQKIHAVTDPSYERAHDLVDLQLLCAAGPDMPTLRELCVRTFEFRRAQPWPPVPLRSMDGWELAYSDAREETEISGDSPVHAHLDAAREWVVELVESIDGARWRAVARRVCRDMATPGQPCPDQARQSIMER